MPDGTMAFTGPDGPGPTGRPGLSPEQKTAVAGIGDFLADGSRRTFSVHGLAGTGKTHLLGHIAKALPDALAATPTGKSAAVLRDRFYVPAKTIHSVFHRLKSETQRTDGRRDLAFEPRRRDGSLAGRIVLIDESSMVTDTLRDQLLATGVKIIAFGDPGQLPPVNGEAGFPRADVTLRTIHRQAAGSPIIRQAHAVRGGGDYSADSDVFQVVRKGSHEHLRQADIVLCHRNDTRRRLNQLTRRVRMNGEIPGRPAADGTLNPHTEFPRQFEPVVVLRNAPGLNLWNGDIELLDQDVRPGDQSVFLFRVSESGNSAGGVEFPLLSFEGMPEAGGAGGGLELAFGYCRTVHSSQGSEWPFVVLVDEFPRTDPQRAAWLYTAITRASQRIVVVNRHCR
jgi:exodeoxyribonuclease-5